MEKYDKNAGEDNYIELWVMPLPDENTKILEMRNNMDWNTLYTKVKPPTMKQVESYIDSSLWNEFNEYIQMHYHIVPYMEYSRCSMQPGWNLKYRKGGKSLCTLYPRNEYFIALVVVGDREMADAELMMPLCSDYVQNLFKCTKTAQGQKWLMLEVRNKETVEDILSLIQLRMKSKTRENKRTIESV